MTTGTFHQTVDPNGLLATTNAILNGDVDATLLLNELTSVCKAAVLLKLLDLCSGHVRELACEIPEAVGIMHGHADFGIGAYSVVAAISPKRIRPRLTWYLGSMGLYEKVLYGPGADPTLMAEVHRLTLERATWRFGHDPDLATRMLRDSYEHAHRAMQTAVSRRRHGFREIQEKLEQVERIMRALGMDVTSA